MMLIITMAFALSTTSLAIAAPLASDKNITNTVKSKLNLDNSLSGTTIGVMTANGVVTLSGNVNSDTQATQATELAQSVQGVKDVNSALTIQGSKQPMTDALITAKIKGLFMQKKLFSNENIAAITINVETNNGIVSLSGTADSQKQIDNALQLAKTVTGVKDVKSTVTLGSST